MNRDNTMVIDLNLEASGTDDDANDETANSNTGKKTICHITIYTFHNLYEPKIG